MPVFIFYHFPSPPCDQLRYVRPFLSLVAVTIYLWRIVRINSILADQAVLCRIPVPGAIIYHPPAPVFPQDCTHPPNGQPYLRSDLLQALSLIMETEHLLKPLPVILSAQHPHVRQILTYRPNCVSCCLCNLFPAGSRKVHPPDELPVLPLPPLRLCQVRLHSASFPGSLPHKGSSPRCLFTGIYVICWPKGCLYCVPLRIVSSARHTAPSRAFVGDIPSHFPGMRPSGYRQNHGTCSATLPPPR